MNFKQLQYVMKVAEVRSFSKAAKLTFSTQPTLSNAISQFEKTMGDKIFIRTTRQVGLTPFGEYILPRIIEILQTRDELFKAAEAYHNPVHKILRIGFSPLVDMARIEQVLAPFRKNNPEISIFFKECFLDDLSERLQKNQIDIKITPEITTRKEDSSYLFYQDNLYYLPSHGETKISDRLSFNVSELPDAPIILTGGGCGLNDALSDLLKSEGRQLKAYQGEAMTYKVIEDWASLGIGAGILPKAKISPDNKAIYPLLNKQGKPVSFKFNWSWRSSDKLDEHLEEFVSYIQQTIPVLMQSQR